MSLRPLFFCFVLCLGAAAHADTVATVNGQPIDAQDLERALTEFAAQRGASRADLERAAELPQLRNAMLRSLIERELLWQAARDRYAVTDAQVEQALNRIRTQLGGASRMEQALAAQGLTEAALAERLRRDLTIQAYLQADVYAGVDVSDADVEVFYRANRERFRSPDLLHLRDIVVAGKNNDAALHAAQQYYTQLKGGADFATLARKQSSDISGRNGGDLGFLNAQDLGEQLAPVVKDLHNGEIAAPHEGPGGVHILKLENIKPGFQASLAEVKEGVREQLLHGKRETALQTRIEQLRKQASIQLN